jgi:urea transporter
VGGARLKPPSREWTDAGAYSFNSLLVGLALSSFYEPGGALLALVLIGAGLALLLSVALGGWLGGHGLPFLSLPSLLTLWLLMLGSGPLLHLAPGAQAMYWLNEVYALGGPRLVSLAQWVGEWPWPVLAATYLRALSAVLFQDSALAGLLVALGLLWHSRIAFSLSLLAFLGAYGLALLTGPATGGINEYNLGANYMVAAIAVGGVFVIPSAASYAWALLSVPVTVVMLLALTAALDRLGLPALSLPYCLTALLFLYVLLLRERLSGWLVLTPVQRYSPERNLYAYTTDRVRLAHQGAVSLTLPFLGAWRCTQGYTDGGPTHQGLWGQALDFAIVDADGCSYQGAGLTPADYYAYNKPVLAPADGVVEEVVQHIDDNAIGQVNTRENWGNTVVLRHAPGLYTQLSHLRPHSVVVQPGAPVRRGDVLGYCGNSGRSPEPHLHFQVQATPYVGARTLAYPLAYFLAQAAAPTEELVEEASAGPTMLPAGAATLLAPPVKKTLATTPALRELRHFTVPLAGETVSMPSFHRGLSQALRLPPGYALEVHDAAAPNAPARRWEVFTDAYNLTYLRCQHSGAVLYFTSNEAVFFCTAFYGPESSWLYLFYLAAYRVPLVALPRQRTQEEFPLTVVRNPVLSWVQDVLAPFYRFLQPRFTLEWLSAAGAGHSVRLRSRVAVAYFGREREEQAAELLFRDGALAELRARRARQEVQLVFSVARA